MSACGIPRTEYEPIGIAKLRVITKLEPLDKDGKLATCTIEGEAWTVVEAIQAIAADAVTTDIEQIEEQVKRIQGKTGKRIVKDAVIKPALEKCKLVIGTVAEDEDGMAIEPSDSAALEGLAAYYLSDATVAPN
jgi:spore coat polysaccharide biosynthesis predicted glycosyltransferase SpsG